MNERLIQLRQQLDDYKKQLSELKREPVPTGEGAGEKIAVRNGDITATGFQIDSVLTEIRLLMTEASNMTLQDTIVVGVLQRADASLSRDTLRDTILERLALFDELVGNEPTTQIPLPLPTPAPAPAPVVEELDAAWYLAELLEEFIKFRWPATIDGAKEHWRQYGKPQGRKGRADGPGWGPRAEFAPPGTVL